MNTVFTNDEMNLMCIYNRDGSRKGMISALKAMRRYLGEDEQELLTLTDSTLQKLERISDGEFEELELVPDFLGMALHLTMCSSTPTISALCSR